MKLQYGRFMYYFQLEDGEMRVFYGEGGFSERPPQDEPWTWCFQYPCIWYHGGMDDPPGWARDAIVYQIFVDRFANGAPPSNDPSRHIAVGRAAHAAFFFRGRPGRNHPEA